MQSNRLGILYYFVLHFAKNHLEISHRYRDFENRASGRKLLTERNFATKNEKSGAGEKRFPVAPPDFPVLLIPQSLTCRPRALYYIALHFTISVQANAKSAWNSGVGVFRAGQSLVLLLRNANRFLPLMRSFFLPRLNRRVGVPKSTTPFIFCMSRDAAS